MVLHICTFCLVFGSAERPTLSRVSEHAKFPAYKTFFNLNYKCQPGWFFFSFSAVHVPIYFFCYCFNNCFVLVNLWKNKVKTSSLLSTRSKTWIISNFSGFFVSIFLIDKNWKISPSVAIFLYCVFNFFELAIIPEKNP